MLLGQDKIKAAIQAALHAGEEVRTVVETELAQVSQLGRAGLVAVTTQRILFAPEQIAGDVTVSGWDVRGTTFTFAPGFLGIEIHIDAAGQPPLRLRRIDGRDLDSLHQALYGEPLGSRLPTLGEWKDALARGVSAQEKQTEHVDLEANAVASAVAERPATNDASAARGATRRATPQKARHQGASSPDSRHAIARAGSRPAAALSQNQGQGQGQGRGHTSAPVAPQKKRRFLRFVLTCLAFGASAWIGSSAGAALAEDEISAASSPELLLAAKEPFAEMADALGGLSALFIPYFMVALVVLLAVLKGKPLYSSRFFKLNIGAACLGIMALVASSGALATLEAEITSQANAHLSQGNERAQQGRPEEALQEYRAYLTLAPDGSDVDAASKAVAECERILAEQDRTAAQREAVQAAPPAPAPAPAPARRRTDRTTKSH